MSLPKWDEIFCRRSRPTSWNLRFSYHVPVSAERLEAAVIESLDYPPTLRSIFLSGKQKARKDIRRMVKIGDITRLRSSHGVPVFMLVKAAIALLNIAKIGGKEAVFGTINAARTWPLAQTTPRSTAKPTPVTLSTPRAARLSTSSIASP